MKIIPFLALLWTVLGGASVVAEQPTWIEIDNMVYGAKPDNQGPIGGGNGYAHIVTQGDYTVTTLDSLLDALSKAKAGQIVFIPGETEIDLTARLYIEKIALVIPEGVTLAGNRGHNGSPGASLISIGLDTPAVIRTAGPNVRITGLRIQGPNPNRCLDHHKRAFGPGGDGKKYYYQFPTSNGIVVKHPKVQIDNCELSAFAHAAIDLIDSDGHHIHHNFIHHCQYNGLGYGVTHSVASSLIEYNLFNWNRHSIAGSGQPGCSYIARNNVQLETSLSHCFDMHGGRDRKDGTDIAGSSIEISNNAFFASKFAVKIRGVPQDKCDVHRNWILKYEDSKDSVIGLSEKTKAFDNVFGDHPTAAK